MGTFPSVFRSQAPLLTALQNVALVSVRQRVSILKELGLEDSMHAFPDELSGGMRNGFHWQELLSMMQISFFWTSPSPVWTALAQSAADVILDRLRDKTFIVVTHKTNLAASSEQF